MSKKPSGNKTSITEEINGDLFKTLYNPDARLQLRQGGLEAELSPETRVFVLGRAKDCDFRVKAARASRTHARIVYRHGKFVLIDQSTNGTYVQPEGGARVLLLDQEEYPLAGSGTISLGAPLETAGDELIHYHFEG
jgi:pSer/pThr/pTyr-binding forkhead associated (FHA) protein